MSTTLWNGSKQISGSTTSDVEEIKSQLKSGSTQFQFGVNNSGEYGYYKNNQIIPFKTGHEYEFGDIMLSNFGTYNLNAGGNPSSIQTNLQQAYEVMSGLMTSMGTDMKYNNNIPVGCFNNQKKYKYLYLGKCTTDYTSFYYRIYQSDGTYVQNIIKSATTGKFNVTAYRIDISNAYIICGCPYCSWTGTGTRQVSVLISNNVYDGYTIIS